MISKSINSIKIMEPNTLIDVLSMLLRILNLADGLHATHTYFKVTLVSDLFQCQIKLKNTKMYLYLDRLLEFIWNMFPMTWLKCICHVFYSNVTCLKNKKKLYWYTKDAIGQFN